MKVYFYGLEDQEEYYNTDIDSVYEELKDYHLGGDSSEYIGIEIIELVKSKKSGIRWCVEYKVFIEGGCKYCDQYNPRNGKNGICKNLSWSLIDTGRRWKITGEYQYKKISGRKLK